MRHGDGGNFHLHPRAHRATQRGIVKPDGTAIAEVGEQHFNFDALPTQPAFQRFAAHLFFRTKFDQIQKGAIGGNHHAILMRNHEGIRQVFRHFQHLCLGRGKPRRLIAGPQGKPHQQHRSAILPEAIGGNGYFAPRIGKLRAYFVTAPGNAHGSQQ